MWLYVTYGMSILRRGEEGRREGDKERAGRERDLRALDVVCEVSPGLEQRIVERAHRVDGRPELVTSVFNLVREHTDYHRTETVVEPLPRNGWFGAFFQHRAGGSVCV